jgi:ABC-2 type transport system permease protein
MKIPDSVLPFSRPYRRVVGAGIGIATAYRGYFFVQFLFQMLPLATQLLLWTAVFASQAPGGSIAGFDRAAMLSYYLLTNLLGLADTESLPWEMAEDIRQGRLNNFLVRPFHYFLYQWHLYVGRLCVEPIFLLIPAALVLYLCRGVLQVPTEGWRLGAFALSAFLGAQLGFVINFMLGTLAFWLINNSSVLHMMAPLQALFSGYWFPLALLPAFLKGPLLASPFAYLSYFPLQVYLGQASWQDTLRGLGIQCLWLLGLGVLATLLWRRAIRAYSAVGG